MQYQMTHKNVQTLKHRDELKYNDPIYVKSKKLDIMFLVGVSTKQLCLEHPNGQKQPWQHPVSNPCCYAVHLGMLFLYQHLGHP